MFSFKPKPVSGQAFLAVGFLLVLVVFEPAFAKSSGKSDLVHPELVGNLTHSGMEKNSLASIKIDTASQYNGQLVEVPILIRNEVEFGRFEMEVDFPYQNLTFIGAERGLALSDTSNGEYNWEYFQYRLLPFPSSPLLYKCLLIGLYDIPNGPHLGIPLAPNPDYVSLVILKFVIDNGGDSSGTFLPIIFEWEGSIVNDTVVADWDCAENTFTDSTADTLYVSHNRLQYDTTICGGGPRVIPSLEFLDGGVYALSGTSIKIDTASQYMGQLVDVPILIRNDVKFGGFEMEVDFPYQNLTFIGAERGLALSDTSNGEYDWEYFTCRVLPFPPAETLYKCLLTGLCDIPNGPHVGVPLALHSDYVSLAVLKFVIGNGGFPPGDFLPIIFEWEGRIVNDTVVEDSDCAENTFADPTADTLYVSHNRLQYDTTICGGGPRVIPSLEFLDGGVNVLHPPNYPTGDINLNWIPYEVADWVLFNSFLYEGDSVLTDPEQQALNSDVNCDTLPWSIADLLYMCRVILHDYPPIPCHKDQESALLKHSAYPHDNVDQYKLVSSSAHPGEVVSVPIWLSNSTIAGGTTFNVAFDSNALSVEGVDTSQTRIEGWPNINPVINPGELFFFGYPDWWQSQFTDIKPGEGVLIKVNFHVNDSVPPGTFLPITFQTEPTQGHYNAYTDTIGLTFVQPPTISGWIFTNVISGDVNSDGMVDVGDLVYLINYLYRESVPPSPVSLGDFNHDAEVNIADVVALINYLFRS